MIQYLPYGGSKWLSQEEIDEFDISKISENNSKEYILEVDLEYHNELHDLHNDYPLAQKNLTLVMICCQNIVLILLMSME